MHEQGPKTLQGCTGMSYDSVSIVVFLVFIYFYFVMRVLIPSPVREGKHFMGITRVILFKIELRQVYEPYKIKAKSSLG